MEIITQALKIMEVGKPFILATADKEGKPNCAPKLLMKKDSVTAYFVDYSIGRSFENLKVNPEVSLSFVDNKSHFGYRLNGKVEIVKEGGIYDECLKEVKEKDIDLSVERIIKGVKEGRAQKHFELNLSEGFLVYRVSIYEGCEISPGGAIKREMI